MEPIISPWFIYILFLINIIKGTLIAYSVIFFYYCMYKVDR